MFDLERLNLPTEPESETDFIASVFVWPCQICNRPRVSGYDVAARAAHIRLPVKLHACPDCGDGSFA